MSDLPILYSFRRCPYAMRARLALRIAQITCEIREVKLSAKPLEMLEKSPKGTVPVLVLPDGQVIDESLDIMHWALAQNDPEQWLGATDSALTEVNDGPFKHHLDRYKYPERHGSNPVEHREAALEILLDLEKRLRVSANLCGEKRGLADMATFPFIRQFAATDTEWFEAIPAPRLREWLNKHISSDLFESVMTRHAPWSAGDDPVLFNDQAT